MDHHPSKRRQLGAATRLIPVLAVVLLAALLALPAATARGGPAPVPPGASPSLAQATPESIPVTTTDPQPEEVTTAALQPEDQSGLFMNVFDCSGSYGGDHQALLENCTLNPTVTFEIFGPNLSLTSVGGFSLERMPAGYYRIHEFLPPGYGDPTAFCGVGPSNDQLPPFSPVVVYDGYYEFELGPSQSIYCNWFHIAAGDPADSASIRINKHFCPPASEFDAYAGTVYDLAANCHEPAMPVPFRVERDGVRIAGGVANGAPDALVFSGLPPVPVAVIETLPEGYGQPRVFCSVKDEFGNTIIPLAEAPTDNDRIFWELRRFDVVFCDWFNVPEPLGVTISLAKFFCPDHVNYDLVSVEDYTASCSQPGADVSFKLDGARTGNPGEQLTDINGQITWSELEADHYYLTEEVPAGYGQPVAFCSYYDPAALQVRVYDRYPVFNGNRIELDLADGQNISCIWFNLSAEWADEAPVATPADPAAEPAPATSPVAEDPSPDEDAAALHIWAFRCQPGYDYLAADATPAADCIEPVDVSFELLSGAPDNQSRHMADISRGGADEITFSGLTPGDHRLTPVGLAADASTFIETCDSTQRDFSNYPFVPFAQGDAGGTIRLSLVAGEILTCDWYEVPAASDAN